MCSSSCEIVLRPITVLERSRREPQNLRVLIGPLSVDIRSVLAAKFFDDTVSGIYLPWFHARRRPFWGSVWRVAVCPWLSPRLCPRSNPLCLSASAYGHLYQCYKVVAFWLGHSREADLTTLLDRSNAAISTFSQFVFYVIGIPAVWINSSQLCTDASDDMLCKHMWAYAGHRWPILEVTVAAIDYKTGSMLVIIVTVLLIKIL